VRLTLSGLPGDVHELTFTLTTPSSQMGLSQFTSQSTASFAADAVPSLDDSSGTQSEQSETSCTLSDPKTLECTGITGGEVKVDFPVALDPLARTTVRITATGDGIAVTSDPVTINPPSADIALSDADDAQLSPDSEGHYDFSGTVTGMPVGYRGSLTFTVSPAASFLPSSSPEGCEFDAAAQSVTCPATSDISFKLVSKNEVTAPTQVTIAVASLPGYIDGSDGAVNTTTVTLQPAATSIKGLHLEVTPGDGSGNTRSFFVTVTGATPNSSLTLALKDTNGNSVHFEALPSACTPVDTPVHEVSCTADDEGAYASPFTLKLPNGQSEVELTVTDEGTGDIDSEPLLPQVSTGADPH
jgi:hypothetical protein